MEEVMNMFWTNMAKQYPISSKYLFQIYLHLIQYRFDFDKNGTIDQFELTCMLQAVGMCNINIIFLYKMYIYQ